jgi:RimJ/RimL family protein N-acetyltransferase
MISKSSPDSPDGSAPLHQPFLEGDGVILRGVTLSDVTDEYHRWLNDPEVSQFLETRFFPQSRESIERYVTAMAASQDSVFLGIIEKKSHRHIGNIKVGPINWIHRFADVSLVVGDKGSWGRGYGADAIRTVTAYAFSRLNLHRLQAHVYAANVGSEKAFLKVGYRLEGIFRQKRFHDGGYGDEKYFAILRPDWESMG